MIKQIDLSHIITSGDFKLDGIWIELFVLRNPPDNDSKQTLTIEALPFAYMDNGQKVWDHNRRKKIHLLDAEDYLLNSGDTKFLQAYFATEDAIAGLLSDRTEWTATFEAPEA